MKLLPDDLSGTLSYPGLSAKGWQALTRPRSIALVGASGRASSVGFTSRFIETNEALGYGGRIYLVNPNRAEILGRKTWKSLDDLPESPDVVAINLPGELVLEAAEAAVARGAEALMIHSGSFGERGAVGALREATLKRLCAEAGVAALGPNCLGVLNLHRRVSVSSINPGSLPPGPVALFSQSGSVAMILAGIAAPFGASIIASTGNEAVTTTEDLIAHAIADDVTRLIVLFVEALRQPDRLFDLAEAARAAGKPILAVKSGLTARGGEVARGHTGAIAGSGKIYVQALRQAGVVLAEDFDELAQAVELFATWRQYPVGGRLGMLGTSGGELGNLTDLAEGQGVSLPPLAEATSSALQDHLVLPDDVLPLNPVDVGTGFAFNGSYQDRMRGAIEIVARDPGVDSVAVLQGMGRDSDQPELSLNREIWLAAATAETAGKPVLAMTSRSGTPDPELMALLRGAGIPALLGAREGLLALRHMTDHLAHRGLRSPMPDLSVPPPRHVWPNGIVPQAVLFPWLASAGLPVTALSSVTATEAPAAVAALGTAVMKIDTPRVVHKSDVGGVALNVTPERAAATHARLTDALSPPLGVQSGEGVVIAEQVAPGTELYLGAKHDAAFGTVVLCGLGGRMLEIIDRTAVLVTPFDRLDALEALDRCGAATILRGYRGAVEADLDALADLILTFGSLARGLGADLEALDLNPVIVNGSHPGGRIADARLILKSRNDR